LVVAAQRVRTGQFDADLGGGLYKQRVARNGGGKSGRIPHAAQFIGRAVMCSSSTDSQRTSAPTLTTTKKRH
jgi:hypothetical protein